MGIFGAVRFLHFYR